MKFYVHRLPSVVNSNHVPAACARVVRETQTALGLLQKHYVPLLATPRRMRPPSPAGAPRSRARLEQETLAFVMHRIGRVPVEFDSYCIRRTYHAQG